MVVPIISAFVGGVALMGSFNGLNTYTAGMFSLICCCGLLEIHGWVI